MSNRIAVEKNNAVTSPQIKSNESRLCFIEGVRELPEENVWKPGIFLACYWLHQSWGWSNKQEVGLDENAWDFFFLFVWRLEKCLSGRLYFTNAKILFS